MGADMGKSIHGKTQGCLNSPQEVRGKVVSMGAEENHLETVATPQGNSVLDWSDGNWELLLDVLCYSVFLGFLSGFIEVSLCGGWGSSNISTTKMVFWC